MRRDRRGFREAIAVEHARALEPRLSTLTIVVPESVRTEGLRVERDDHGRTQASWSTPMPVDGGEHLVRVTARGKEPFESTVAIAKEGDAHTVEIPPLRDERSRLRRPRRGRPRSRWSLLRPRRGRSARRSRPREDEPAARAGLRGGWRGPGAAGVAGYFAPAPSTSTARATSTVPAGTVRPDRASSE